MQRQQKTEESGYLYEDKVELESSKGVPSTAGLEADRRNGAEELLEQILQRDNLNKAFQKVRANQGKHGVDGLSIKETLAYLKANKEELLESLRKGTYKPHPVRRVEIPKAEGGTRQLGIPTVTDRMIQQAMVQILQPIFEPTFSTSSYGFRPKRSAHEAMRQAKKYYKQGYKRVVDIDLAQYFDTINHDKLIEMIREQVKDERVIQLIRQYLKSGAMENGIYQATSTGAPQGGNLSPLLSNIYLTKFDRELEKRGHKFVRYADDCNIYVKSQRSAERVMASSKKYLEGKLKLKVNEKKSQIGSPMKLKFLGFSLCKIGKETEIRTHEKSIKRLKAKLKEKTRRNRGIAIEIILKELKSYTIGWMGYYGIAKMKKQIQSINEWLRRRIRMYIWKQWKRVRTRYANLKKQGITEGKAWEWANTRAGYWRIAGSPIMSRALTNEKLAKLGYYDIAQHYEILHSNY